MKKLYERYRTFMVEVVLRKMLIPAVLTISYFVGVGLSAMFVRVFMRKKLHAARVDDQTWWKEAGGNEADREKCLRQS